MPLKLVFRYFYYGSVELTNSNVFRVLELAKKHLVEDLIKSCADYIDGLTLDSADAIRLFVDAQRCGDIPPKYATLGLWRHITATSRFWSAIETIAASAIESSEFLLLDRAYLREFLRSDKLRANEVAVYTRLKAWAAHQLHERYASNDLTTNQRKPL